MSERQKLIADLKELLQLGIGLKDGWRKTVERAIAALQVQQEPVALVPQLEDVIYDILCDTDWPEDWARDGTTPEGFRAKRIMDALQGQREPTYERAQYFQAGFVGSGPDEPQIIHYAGADVTCVAIFRREADRDYFLSLLPAQPKEPA